MKFVKPVDLQTDTTEKVIEQEASFFTHLATIPDDFTIPSTKNCFLCGPVNFTGSVDVNGVLNVV